jgi:hypothetical protein
MNKDRHAKSIKTAQQSIKRSKLVLAEPFLIQSNAVVDHAMANEPQSIADGSGIDAPANQVPIAHPAKKPRVVSAFDVAPPAPTV